MLVASSCPTLFNLMDCSLPGSCLWNSPGKNGFPSPAKLPAPGIKPGSPDCRQIQESMIRKYSLSSEVSQKRIKTFQEQIIIESIRNKMAKSKNMRKLNS